MISNKERILLQCLFEQKDAYVTSNELALILSVSQKTVQSTIKRMNFDIISNGANIESSSRKGYKLVITDPKFFTYYSIQNYQSDFSSRIDRVHYTIMELINSNDYVNIDDLAEKMFISKSTFLSDERVIKQLLSNYDLKLVSKYKLGIQITGLESDKRLYIAKEDFLVKKNYVGNVELEELMNTVRNNITDVLIEEQYEISNYAFQNLVLNNVIAITRIKNGQNISSNDYNVKITEINFHDFNVASKVMLKHQISFNLDIDNNEIIYLSLILAGKKVLKEKTLIPVEIEKLISSMLEHIFERFEIDFTIDTNLSIQLALHIMPLLLRIKLKTQIENSLKDEIHLNYPLAFDIAILCSKIITKNTNSLINDSEISFIAIHFILALERKRSNDNPKRILILCSSAKSESLLLRQRFYQWFKDKISSIKILNHMQDNGIDLTNYDLIFTTDIELNKQNSSIHLISPFLKESDYTNIANIFSNRGITQDLCNRHFFKDLSFFGQISSKDEIIDLLCNMATVKFNLNIDLSASVKIRESLATTCFGNLVAIPHPEGLVTPNTFFAVAVLDNPIVWDEYNSAQIIILVSVGYEDRDDLLSFYDSIAKIIQNKELSQKILMNKNYENFISVLKNVIS